MPLKEEIGKQPPHPRKLAGGTSRPPLLWDVAICALTDIHLSRLQGTRMQP